MSKTTRTAYSYLRFSTPEQLLGDSQRRQVSEAERACAEFGWALSQKSFKDLGTSAFRGLNRRKGDLSLFLEMLEGKGGKLEAGAVLILEDFDRLSRDKIMASFDLVRRILDGGIDLFCVMSWRLYTRESLSEPMALLEMIWRFYLAHEESLKKSVRSKANWQQKRDKALSVPMTKLCPAWLRIEGGDSEPLHFAMIPERVAVVRDIFAWCIDGLGVLQIERRLNRTGIPPFKSSWGQKYIHSILTDCRVRGWHTPKAYGDTVTDRDLIKGYYPRIIEDATFYAADAAIQARKGKTGRRGDFVNLFTGLAWDPYNKCSLVMVNKSKKQKGKLHSYRYLCSFKGFKGLADYFAVRYEVVEQAVLSWLWELKASDLDPGKPADDTSGLEAEVKFLDARIAEVAEHLGRKEANVAAVLKAISDLEERKEKLIGLIDDRKRAAADRPDLEDTQELAKVLDSVTGDERRARRERLRQRLLGLVKRIDVRALPAPRGEKAYGIAVHPAEGPARLIRCRVDCFGKLIGMTLLPAASEDFDAPGADVEVSGLTPQAKANLADVAAKTGLDFPGAIGLAVQDLARKVLDEADPGEQNG